MSTRKTKILKMFLVILPCGFFNLYNLYGNITPEEVSGFLAPYCLKTGTTVEALDEQFGRQSEWDSGSYRFEIAYAAAMEESFDPDNLERSRLIKANVLFGLIWLAHRHINVEQMPQAIKNALLVLREGKKPVFAKLSHEEKVCLDEISSDSEGELSSSGSDGDY